MGTTLGDVDVFRLRGGSRLLGWFTRWHFCCCRGGVGEEGKDALLNRAWSVLDRLSKEMYLLKLVVRLLQIDEDC